MLHYSESGVKEAGAPLAEPGGGAEFVDVDRILAVVRRQAWVVMLAAGLGFAGGIAYLFAAVPLYTATIDLLIDKGQSKRFDQMAAPTSPFQDEAEMLSQVELLKSDQISRAVARQLKLVENEAFLDGNPSVLRAAIAGVRGLLSTMISDTAPEIDTAPPTEDRAVAALQDNVTVERVGQTYVLQLGFTSPDPAMASQIAGAYGDAYLDDQLQAKYEATRRASGWLQDRIAELKQQSYNADLAVQTYRNETGLIASGEQLMSQQQLGEITSQLVAAQANTAEAKARLDQIRRIIDSGNPNEVVSDALASQTINTLRDSYLDAARRETEIAAKLGPDHAQAVRLRAQMQEYERLIFGELGRIAQSYQSTYDVAMDRQKSVEQSLDALVNVNEGANTQQVKLRELEREAETFRSLYDNFLQRYQQTVQQQSFPITDARIITPPTLPEKPSAPRSLLVLAMFMALGVAAGSGVAVLREYRERFFRIGSQVRSELDAEFLGYTPAILPLAEGDEGHDSHVSSLWPKGSLATHVRQRPHSAFSETLRNVKVAADLAMPDLTSKVIGIVSCIPAEGKSTISANLGNLFAMQGGRTLLIDGDLRNPGLTRGLERRPEAGLIEVVLGEVAPASAIKAEESGGSLSVLPAILKRRVTNTSELLASATMARMLAQFRTEYDYIVVDLPPIGPVVDAKAFASRVDAFVLVVEWGRTSRQLVRSLMANNSVFHRKCLGVVLNNADSRRMKLYRSYGSPEYYSKRYDSYFEN